MYVCAHLRTYENRWNELRCEISSFEFYSSSIKNQIQVFLILKDWLHLALKGFL